MSRGGGVQKPHTTQIYEQNPDKTFRNFPVTPTPSTFSEVLPYKWEAYCSTNGRCTVGFPFLEGLEARKVQRYNGRGGGYCRTNWRCTAVLSSRPVGVGVSETFLRYDPKCFKTRQTRQFCSFFALYVSETSRIQFRRVRFQTPSPVSFFWPSEERTQ